MIEIVTGVEFKRFLKEIMRSQIDMAIVDKRFQVFDFLLSTKFN